MSKPTSQDGQPGRPESPSEILVPFVCIDDPVCAKECGACWSCLRSKHGPLYFLKGKTS